MKINDTEMKARFFADDYKEEWKDVLDFEGLYQVSNFGNIKRWKKYKLRWNSVKPFPDMAGYMKVGLWLNYTRKITTVHKLVAIAFLDNPNGFQEINHINGDKSDNRSNNLEWCTRSHNMKEAIRLGLKNLPSNKRDKSNGQYIKS